MPSEAVKVNPMKELITVVLGADGSQFTREKTMGKILQESKS
jgi:hypothetical protein